MKAHNYAEYELCRCFSRNLPKIFRAVILKENLPMHVPYFIKEHLWMSASNEVTLQKNFDGSKPSSKLTLKIKWYHRCGSCDDCRSCEQLKKHAKEKYFEKKLDFEP